MHAQILKLVSTLAIVLATTYAKAGDIIPLTAGQSNAVQTLNFATRDSANRLPEAISLAETGTEDDDAVLALLEAAETYSEALLLARVAAGAFAGDVPQVPEELESIKGAAFVFESWNVVLSAAVTKRLTEIREERNAWLDEMTEEEIAAYKVDTAYSHNLLRARLAMALGRPEDALRNGDVVEGPDGSIWRRQAVAEPAEDAPTHGAPGGGPWTSLDEPARVGMVEETSEAPSVRVRLGAPVAGADPTQGPPSSQSGDVTGEVRPQGQVVGGSDERDLRSRSNGYLMNTSVWGPKMLLTDLANSADPPSGTAIDLDCSGTKISARIIITAGHCLFKNGSWNNTRRFVPGADSLGQLINGLDPSPNGNHTSQWRRVRGNWFDHEWDNYDFGLLVLYDSSPLRCWWWHGWQENASGLTQDLVYLYGYPGENQDCGDANSTHPNGLCFASIYGHGKNVISEGAFRFAYAIDTQSGQSGSGVYKISGNDRIVYGVHRGAFGCCENDAVRLNDGNSDMIVDAQNDYPASPC